jgi:uncharacterized RDD family membrane protein YckC
MNDQLAPALAQPQILAGRGKRLGGVIIDALIVAVILVPILFVTGAFRLIFGGEYSFGRQAGYGLLACGIWLVLNGSLLARSGQTIGKKAVGTKIVDLSGALPPFGKLVALRYVLPFLIAQIPFLGGLFGLIDALFIFGNERRCIHDYLAGTRVVEA